MKNIMDVPIDVIKQKDITDFLMKFYFSDYSRFNYNDYIQKRNVKIHFRNLSEEKIIIDKQPIEKHILGLLYKGEDTESNPYIIVENNLSQDKKRYIIFHELTHLMMAETKDKHQNIQDFFIKDPIERYKNNDEKIIDMLTLLILIKKENLENIKKILTNKEISELIGVEEYIIHNYYEKIKEIDHLFN